MMDAKQQFLTIFNNKGNIGPIAEKSRRNLEIIGKNENCLKERVYYFCIGHAFKNIDKSIFEYQYDTGTEKLMATNFKSLSKDAFVDYDEKKKDKSQFYKLVENIRDCNSHYVHTFDKLKCSQINASLLQFISDAFEFAFIQVYMQQTNQKYSELKDRKDDKNLVRDLADKFLIKGKEKDEFLKCNLKKAINNLLFVEVENSIPWKLDKSCGKSIFDISKGTYLSFVAQLFVLSLFLYKDEANLLISKISGFKKNDDKFHYKRDIFTFFSKKLTSQDIDNEERYLVRFRDIIQYLNKYPTEWNQYLEPQRKMPQMTNALEKYVIETEVFRSFPTYANTADRPEFLKYAVHKLCEKPKRKLFNFTSVNYKAKEVFYQYELDRSPEYKDKEKKIQELTVANSRKHETEICKLTKEQKELSEDENPIKKKLQQRIKDNKLLPSYGRNQDRFMQMVLRFLAENDYFGKDAEFKMYRFYDADSQLDYLEKQKKDLPKKEYDKLKFHQGRCVYFTSYADHASKYSEWDEPFVIENNATQIKLRLTDGEVKLFSVQRKLLVYLLEHALFVSSESLLGSGRILLIEYLKDSLDADFTARKQKFEAGGDVQVEAIDKKLFPKRYLEQFRTDVLKNQLNSDTPYQKMLCEAVASETRYSLLRKKAKDLNLENEFDKKNKGKQFKLRFVRKAWHLMYFKSIYLQQVERKGHHKHFHITRDEFNDFCRYMFASSEEVPQYKELLKRMLLSKKFFDNKEFEGLFNDGKSLDDWYTRTKEKFEQWAETTALVPLDRKNDYEKILSKPIIYINISHFMTYMKAKGFIRVVDGKLNFQALANVGYLVEAYYYKCTLPQEEFKTNGKLYNKLRDVRLEDALLYELAMRYLQMTPDIMKQAKADVRKVFDNDITIEIKQQAEYKYHLQVPFAKLESLAVLLQHKKDQEADKKSKGTSFLGNISHFITEYQGNDIMVSKLKKLFNNSKVITFDELHAINNYIITGSVKFSQVQMALERYFILKNSISLEDDSAYIDIDCIKDVETKQKVFNNGVYNKNKIRNKAYHFGIPEEDYLTSIGDIEKTFIETEIKGRTGKQITSFGDLDNSVKPVCNLFMNFLHSELYERTKYKKMTREQFKEKYIEVVINNKKVIRKQK